MSTTSMSLPLGKSDRIAIRMGRSSEPVTIPDKIFCWAVTLGMTLWTATTWLNERWILGLFELGAFTAVLGILFQAFGTARVQPIRAYLLLAFALPACGVLQLVTGYAAYAYATLLATLDWSAFAGMVCVGMYLLAEERRRIYFFTTLTLLGVVVTGMELYQIFILGQYEVLRTGFPLLSSNNYAELSELVLPVVTYLAWKRSSGQWWLYGLAALIVATVIASGARSGSLLVLVECALFLWSSRHRRRLSSKRVISPWIGFALLSLFLIVVEGSDLLWFRLFEAHPLEHRLDFVTSAYVMMKSRPIFGVGLGCFPVVYPQFQQYDSAYVINHVHNDYMEFLTDGGVIFLAIWLSFLVMSLRNGIRSFWGMGCLGILIHSFTDFPLYRPAVAALFAVLIAGVAEKGIHVAASVRSR